MNRKIASALLTGLLCVGSVTARAAEPSPVPAPPPGPQVGASGFMPGNGPARGGAMGRQCFSMKQALDLSDKQDARLRELRQAHFQESAALRQELFRLQGELASESVNRHPDDRKIADLAGMIGKQHEKMAMLRSRHLREVASVLNRKQVEAMLRMKESRGMRGMNGRDPGMYRGGCWK